MPPPLDPPADVAALFQAERAALLRLLAELGPDDWDRRTPCPAWDVLELCCHLVGDDLSLLARHRDGHAGTTPPDGATEAEFHSWLDELQQEWVRAARRLSPRLVVDLLAWSGPQLVELQASQDPRRRTASVTWAGPNPVPVWLDHVRELSEYWIHRQQLLQALGRPSDLQPTTARVLLDGLCWAYPHRLAPVPAEEGDTVSIEVTGPVTATWLLVSDGDGWDFRPEPGPQLVARLAVTTEQAWRLLTNNLTAAEQHQLDVSGRPEIVAVLRGARAVLGTPS